MTVEEVKSAFKKPNRYAMLPELASSIKELYPIYRDTDDKVLRKAMKDIMDRSTDIFAHRPRTQQYSLKAIKPIGPLPEPVRGNRLDTQYIGTAGEMAVASELLFQGYGVSRPAVDTGVDIIAQRGTSVYFVQVKTSCLDENHTAKFSIKKASYERHAEDYVRYVLVIRCGDGSMRFFTFSQESIDRLARSQDRTYSITIKYDNDSHKPAITSRNSNNDIYDYRGVKI